MIKFFSSFVGICSLFALFTVQSCAQGGSSNSSYTAGNEGWLVNLDEAFEKSRKTGKPVMANFTGSDWCGWCKRLTAAVFSKPEFKEWADKNVILLELDYPRFKQLPANIQQQNQSMQQFFQIRGYPTVCVFDITKDTQKKQYQFAELGRTGYRPTVAEFTGDVDRMLANRKK
ncbi:MAG TPA: thioredoxin family protein [Saprospiraceae bacterium]|nr:thioredoxin family protein [Saprospiraceae bacterium]